MTAIDKYVKRRAKRLAERGIKLSREDGVYRRDDDEEKNRNSNAGGHGNTRLPFGLCQREGIEIDPKWTPADAWEALEGKGYSAKEAYAELKETGKVSKKGSSAKTKSQRMQTSGLPYKMKTGSGLKKLTAFNTEFQKMELEEHVSDFVANAGDISFFGKPVSDFDILKSKAGGGDYLKTWKNVRTGEITKVRLRIPDLNKVPEQYKNSEATVFAHELIHYVNLCRRNSNQYDDYTDLDEGLTQAVRNARSKGVGSEVRSFLEEASKRWAKTRDEYTEETNRIGKEINGKWMERTKELGTPGQLPSNEYAQYKKERDEFINKRNEEFSWIKHSFEDGAASLSNMYDALTFGRLGDEKVAWYGHTSSYFRGNANSVKNEMLSIYVELHMAKDKKYLKMFREDQPELASALDSTIRTLLKETYIEGY